MSMSQAFAFNAESWQSCTDVVVQLSKVFRQKDERYSCLFSLSFRRSPQFSQVNRVRTTGFRAY